MHFFDNFFNNFFLVFRKLIQIFSFLLAVMLSWKMAACLAAGNTVVLKPCQMCPLTALKFAELSVQAGFPPGVINIVPGTGSSTG